MNENQPARVVSVGRNHVWIVFAGESTPERADIRKTLAREMLVPGDRVTAERGRDGAAFVVDRSERTSTLERRTLAGRKKIMAANITMLLVAAAFNQPPPNFSLLDELLAFAEDQRLEAALLLSKADLCTADECAAITAIYENLGYAVHRVDAREEGGYSNVDAILAALTGREALLVGASGVGKSTFFKAIGGMAVVGDVSERTGRGKQTTSSGRLHYLTAGTLIDSPGIGEFRLENIDPRELANLWVELRPFLGKCRFVDCRHRNEPDCGLLAAVAAGAVAPTRWNSYLRAYERLEIEQQERDRTGKR